MTSMMLPQPPGKTGCKAVATRCRRIARRLDDEGSLAQGWSVESAADLIWALTNVPAWRDLVRDRGWSNRRYRDRIGEVLRTALLR